MKKRIQILDCITFQLMAQGDPSIQNLKAENNFLRENSKKIFIKLIRGNTSLDYEYPSYLSLSL